MSLRDLWRKEVNGIARRYIRTADIYGRGEEAALETIAAGADLETVAEALGYRNGEPPEGLVKLATEKDLEALLASGQSTEEP